MVRKFVWRNFFHVFNLNFSASQWLVENSIQKMQSKLAKDLRSFDTALELIKKEIPLKVLQMTMKEASLLKVLNEADVDENRTNLNVTVKETVSKADEGKSSLHHFHFLSSLSTLSFIALSSIIFSISFLPTLLLKLKVTLQKRRVLSHQAQMGK
jgi:hypothetical protein